jgi:hypothetical protein
MSTPIHQLPNGKPPVTASLPDDPEVLNVLQEMEQEVQTATKANIAPTMPMPPPMQPVAPPQPLVPIPVKKQKKKLYEPTILYHAALVAFAALVLFFPKTLEVLYTKVPKLALLERYDILVRSLLLGVVVYAVTWKFGL